MGQVALGQVYEKRFSGKTHSPYGNWECNFPKTYSLTENQFSRKTYFIHLPPGKTFDVFNPTTAELIASVPDMDDKDTGRAIEAAAKVLLITSKYC